jgi:O-antigen/teichoic acid export membrane protein
MSKSIKHISVFILAIFFTRYFTAHEYGTYIQIMFITHIAIALGLLGIPSSIYYFFPRIHEKKRMIKNTLFILLLSALFSALCIYASIDILAKNLNNTSLNDYTFLIVAFIFLQIPTKLYEPFMVSAALILRFVSINATFNIVFLLVILIPLYFDHHLESILWGLFYFFVIQFLVIYSVMIYTYYHLRNEPLGEKYEIKEQFRYSLPIAFSGLFSQLGVFIDKVIVSASFSPETLAIYTRGAMEIPMLNVIANSLSNILMPKLVDEYRQKNIHSVITLWHRSIIMMAWFVYPCLFFFLTMADELITFLFTEAYKESVFIFQIYSLSLIGRITSYDSIIRAAGKTHILFKMTLLAILLNISLTFILIDRLGLIGAPIATVIIGLLLRIIYLLMITRLLKCTFLTVFPWIKLMKLIAAACIPALLLWGLIFYFYSLYQNREPLLMLLFSGLFYSFFYLFLLKKMNILNLQEKQSLQRFLPFPFRQLL